GLWACEESEAALVMKVLRDLDGGAGADVSLLFAEDFDRADTFMARIADRLQEEHRLTNEAVGDDLAKLPALPAEFLDPTAPPGTRLEAGMRYARSLIDPRRGQHFLWGLGPLRIGDAEGYLELLAQLPPKPDIRPWMRGGRIVARVPVDFQIDRTPLANFKRVQVKPFVIPPNAQEEELLAAADDPKAPLGNRMQAEVQLAYLDHAPGRFGEAARRFLKALLVFQWAETRVREDLIIGGRGDLARQQGDWKQVQHWYACAVEPAAKAENPILMSKIVQNLAVAAF